MSFVGGIVSPEVTVVDLVIVGLVVVFSGLVVGGVTFAVVFMVVVVAFVVVVVDFVVGFAFVVVLENKTEKVNGCLCSGRGEVFFI